MKTPNALRKTIATLLICGATLTSSVAFAQDNPVVAKVGNSEITKSALDQAVLRLQQQFASVPENQRRARILDALIDFAVLATEAEKRDLDKQADTVELLKYLRLQALHNAYFRQVIDKSVTEEDLKKAYETQFAGKKPEKEVKARHILVKTEDEAKAIIKLLDEGGDFIELAKEKSTGPSGPQGGDLGYFGKGRMVPEFEAAAFAMKAGEYSKTPVRTQFGWHILKVDEVRDVPLPTFEASKAELRQIALSAAYEKAVKDGRSANKVEILDESLMLPGN